jgi:hypothetical protein
VFANGAFCASAIIILDSRQTGVPADEFPEWAKALPANIDMPTATAVAVSLNVFIFFLIFLLLLKKEFLYARL